MVLLACFELVLIHAATFNAKKKLILTLGQVVIMAEYGKKAAIQVALEKRDLD